MRSFIVILITLYLASEWSKWLHAAEQLAAINPTGNSELILASLKVIMLFMAIMFIWILHLGTYLFNKTGDSIEKKSDVLGQGQEGD